MLKSIRDLGAGRRFSQRVPRIVEVRERARLNPWMAILSSGNGHRLHRTMPAVEGVATPSGSQWVHEIKHDGYRLMVRRDASEAVRREREDEWC